MAEWNESVNGKLAYYHLMALKRIFREIDREDLEDDVYDILDAVCGWCSPHRRVEWKADPLLREDV